MSLANQLANETPEQAEQRVLDEAIKKHERDLRAKRQAKRNVDAADNPVAPIPSSKSLTERLKVKKRPTAWRIDGWLQCGHRAMLIAQYKAGKTSLAMNVVRSLVDVQTRFLDRFDCSPVTRVTVLDFEMAKRPPTHPTTKKTPRPTLYLPRI
jgi:hypothetical protein